MFDFPKIEEKILKFWQENEIFNKLKEKNKDGKPWSFLDGPITANNPMGVHHAWGRTLKDLFQRYHAMRGEKMRYQNGFDCQGLWVEVEVEKELGFKTKKDIEKYGIDKFVNKCKERADKYAGVQTEQSKRLGYWMDWDNSYYTMSDENNYMIWHFLKKVWEGGNLYKGRDSVPWCPRCGTAISQHEILGEEYQEITHKSVFFKLPIEGRQGEYFLVWTTTPWTLPANVALAVGSEIDYVKINYQGHCGGATMLLYKKGIYILAKDILWRNLEAKHDSVIKDFIGAIIIDNDDLSQDIVSSYKAVRNEYGDLEDGDRKQKTMDYFFKNYSEKYKFEIVKGKSLVDLKYQGPFDDLPRIQAAREENLEIFHTVISANDLVTTEEGTGIVHIAPGCGAEDFQLGKERNLPVIDVINEAANYLNGLGEFSDKNAKRNPDLIFDYLKNKEGGKYLFRLEDYTHRYPKCWRCKEELVWRVVDEWYISMDNLREKMVEVANKINWIPGFGLDRELDWLKNMHDWLISKKRYWGLALPIWECECGRFEVIGSKEELKERAVEGWEEFKGNTPHKPWIDAIKIKCSKCGNQASRIPDVGNPWLDAGIVPFSTYVDPKTKKLSYTDDKKYWQEWFPADFVTECFPGQFKNWFYSLIAMSTVLENTNPFKTLLGHALVKDENGEEMHKSKGNAIWFDDAVDQMGADVMRWMYTSNNPAIDLRFGYHKGDEVKREVFIPLLNVVNFYKIFSQGFSQGIEVPYLEDQDLTNALDKWINSKLNLLIKDVTQRLDNFDPACASREVQEFITELSVWYVRRSRDRFKSQDQAEKMKALKTLRRVLFHLIKLMAPFTPFIAEHIYKELGGRLESVHLEEWPEVREEFINQKVLDYMEAARKIVELGLAKRAEAGIKVRQPLKKLEIRNQKLGNEYLELIKDELNVKEVVCGKGKGDELSVELDTEITEDLKKEGVLRDLVRAINGVRKKMGLTIDDKVNLFYNSQDKLIEQVIDEFGDELKRSVIAESINKNDDELDKVKVGDVEVGISLKQSITKHQSPKNIQ